MTAETEVQPETRECRIFGCSEEATRFKYVVPEGDDAGLLDRVFMCGEHMKKSLKEVRPKISGQEDIQTPPSVAHDEPVPLNETGQAALGSGVEDVTAVGLTAAPETLRAFRCPADEWDSFVGACALNGDKPNLVVRTLMKAYRRDVSDAGQDA